MRTSSPSEKLAAFLMVDSKGRCLREKNCVHSTPKKDQLDENKWTKGHSSHWLPLLLSREALPTFSSMAPYFYPHPLCLFSTSNQSQPHSISFLFQPCNFCSHLELKVFIIAYEALYITPMTHFWPDFCTFPLAHSASATLTSLLFFKYS